MIFRLLNTGLNVPHTARRRLWVVPNQPVHLITGVSFRVVLVRGSVLSRPYIEFTDPESVDLVPLAVQLRTDIGLVFIPRAVELGPNQTPLRFLFEIALATSGGNMPGLSISQR